MSKRITRQAVAASLLTMLASAAGCRSATDASTPTVVGSGAKASSAEAWQSTVAITRHGHLQCSGAAITPTLVITAAHCLPDGSDHVRTLKVHVGSGVAGGRYDGELAIVKAQRHPESRRGNVWGNADIAYLVLAEPLAVAPIPVVSSYDVLKDMTSRGAAATIVGFGITDNATRSLGVKFEATTTVKYATAQEAFLGDSRGDACGGDSGGPVFGQVAGGQWRQFGVTSRGPLSCGSDLYPGAFSLITPHLCWIERDSGVALGADGASLCPDASLNPATIDVLSLCREAARADHSIRCDDLAAWSRTVRTLDLARQGISDLTPLQAFANLEHLNLEDNAVKDLSPLADLTKLSDLRIGWNDISSLAPVQGILSRGGRIRGGILQNAGWQPRRDTAFLGLCQQAEAGTLSSEPDLLHATLAIKRSACLGDECGCYTANDNLNKTRGLNLGDARDLRSLAPLQATVNLQYLVLPPGAGVDRAVLASLENLQLLAERAWPE